MNTDDVFKLLGVMGLLLLVIQISGALYRIKKQEDEKQRKRTSPVLYKFDEPSNLKHEPVDSRK